MKFLVTLMLMWVIALPAFAALPCEVALSRTLRAMLELTKAGLKKQMLQPAQLERDFAGGKFLNPFIRNRASIEGGQMYDAFDSHIQGLSVEQQTLYRAELAKIVAFEVQQRGVSHRASEATREVLNPYVLTSADPQKYSSVELNKMNLIHFEGREILAGSAYLEKSEQFPEGETVNILFDALNPSGPRIVELERRARVSGDWGGQDFQGVTLNGQTYALNMRSRKLYKLPNGEEVHDFDSRLKLIPLPAEVQAAALKRAAEQTPPQVVPPELLDYEAVGPVLLKQNGQVSFVATIASWLNPQGVHMAMSSLTGEATGFQKIADGASLTGLTLHKAGSHNLISWQLGHLGIQFFDMSNGAKPFPTLVSTPGTYREHRAYEVNGEKRAILMLEHRDNTTETIVVDLKDGTKRSLGAGGGALEITNINGKPFAYLFGDGGVLWIDLTTETPHKIPVPAMGLALHSFAYKGHPYLIWGMLDGHSRDGQVIVLDVDAQTTFTFDVPGGETVIEAQPFLKDGVPYAYITQMKGPPALIKLVNGSR